MARGRMVSQTIATDKKLNELSIEAELLYLKTIPHLDRDGLILGEPMLLWAQVCPRRQELMHQIGALINEWIAAGLVFSYVDNGDTILYFPGFVKNQIGMRYDREAPSRFGPPPGFTRTHTGMIPQGSTPVQQPQNDENSNLRTSDKQDTEQLRTSSGLTPDEVPPNRSIREEKRREVNGGGGVVPADDGMPPSAPQQRQTSSKPERKSGTVTHFDARKLDTNGLLPKNSGKTLIEIWKESFTWMPTAAQIRDMNERVTDSAKWRQITTECALKGFRSYPNVIDVYVNGWRNAAIEAIPHKAVSGDIGLNMGAI